MFKFEFQLDEEEDGSFQSPLQSEAGPSTATLPPPSTKNEGDQKCYHITLDELIKALPEEISYSPLPLPFLRSPILRRDLFDARFQLYNRQSEEDPSKEGQREEDEGEEYVDAKTDLIPGLYEGGLKSWEGGVDLVEVLSSIGDEEGVGRWVEGGRVLEVGCGTALPTLYLLRSLLSSSSSFSTKTTFHVQDYNSLVLSLVTLPNLILATLPYLPPEVLHQPNDEEDVEEVIPDLENPGNLVLSPQLVEGFRKLLEERNIELKFTYGHWSGFAGDLQKEGEEGYGLVLTAETIYAEDSNASLLSVLENAIKRTKALGGDENTIHKEEVRLEDSLDNLKVNDEWKNIALKEQGDGFILVAAKILYFGVGGGLTAFLNRVEDNEGWWKGVKDWTKGVGRKVVQVGW